MSDVQDQFTGTQPVAPHNAFDEARLAAWMSDNVAGFQGPMSVAQFKGGQSNPTFLLTAGGHRYVLRRKRWTASSA
jgi:aminoglycoside phosphotransferase (APT) family kinase protein